MWFFTMMFLCNLLMPLIMIIGGYYMFKYPPKEINSVLGYRTKMSKKNKDTWTFAHHYCGRLWIKLGAILFIPTILVQLPFLDASDDMIGIVTLLIEAVQLGAIIASILTVEKALKRTSDDNGIRR